MQLFGLRKTSELSLASRQPLAPFAHERAQSSDRAVGENRPIAYSGKFCGRKSTKETVETIARGMPGVPVDLTVTNSCAFYFAYEAAGVLSARLFLRPLLRVACAL
jgi:hypothetical protein